MQLDVPRALIAKLAEPLDFGPPLLKVVGVDLFAQHPGLLGRSDDPAAFEDVGQFRCQTHAATVADLPPTLAKK